MKFTPAEAIDFGSSRLSQHHGEPSAICLSIANPWARSSRAGISAIERFNDLTPDLLQQLTLQSRVSSSGSTDRIRLAIRPSSRRRVFVDTPLRIRNNQHHTRVASGSLHRNGVLGPRIAVCVAARDELIRRPKRIVRRRHLDVDVGGAP